MLFKLACKTFANRRGFGLLNRIVHYSEYLRGIGTGHDTNTSGEKAFLYNLRHSVPNNLIIFDVGANIGRYSEEAIKIFSPKKFTIHCFEPSNKTFAALTNNTLLAQRKEQIVFNKLALGSKNSSGLLYTNEACTGLASMTKRRLDHFDIKLDVQEEITIITLDTYADQMGIKRIDLLKVDVEGHELDVFHGAQQSIKQRLIKMIQFEFGGCNIDTRTYFQDFWYFFNSNGYSLHRITPTGWLYPINKYTEDLERFTTMNYVAILN